MYISFIIIESSGTSVYSESFNGRIPKYVELRGELCVKACNFLCCLLLLGDEGSIPSRSSYFIYLMKEVHATASSLMTRNPLMVINHLFGLSESESQI